MLQYHWDLNLDISHIQMQTFKLIVKEKEDLIIPNRHGCLVFVCFYFISVDLTILTKK